MLLEATCPKCSGIATRVGNSLSCPLCGDTEVEEEPEPQALQQEAPVSLDILAIKDGYKSDGASFNSHQLTVKLDKNLVPRLPDRESKEFEDTVAFAVEFMLGYLEVVQELPDLPPPQDWDDIVAHPLSSQSYALSLLSQQSGLTEEELMRRALVLYLKRDE